MLSSSEAPGGVATAGLKPGSGLCRGARNEEGTVGDERDRPLSAGAGEEPDVGSLDLSWFAKMAGPLFVWVLTRVDSFFALPPPPLLPGLPPALLCFETVSGVWSLWGLTGPACVAGSTLTGGFLSSAPLDRPSGESSKMLRSWRGEMRAVVVGVAAIAVGDGRQRREGV